jgi:hypothetical protein
VAADLVYQPAQKGTGLGATRPAGRAQHGGHRPALAVEHHDRLEAVLVVVGIEEPKLLPTMDGIEGVIHVQDDAPRHLPEAGAVQPDHGARHAQQRPRSRQVLEPRDGWL